MEEVQSRCLGLIGGLGVGATVHYYRELARAHAARGSALRLLMAHADMARVVNFVEAGEHVGLARYLAELISQLHAGGAEVAAVPAVTPHICATDLAIMSPLPLVNMLEVVEEEIQGRGFRRVALFGTRFTMETGLFGRLRGVEIVRPKREEADYIHDTYARLARDGEGSSQDHAEMTVLARTLCERDGAEVIVLAGTDLAVLFNESNTDFPHLDCARLHIEAITRALFEGTG